MPRMRTLRRLIRLPLLAVYVVYGAVLTLLFARHRRDAPPPARFAAIERRWLRGLLKILGVRLHVTGEPARGGVLYVANHISWLDIPVIGAVLETAFLSKQEVRRWPVVGWLAARAGTLFIQRGGSNAANAATEAMTWQLVGNRPVLIFPEGTTSTGETVLRFHPRLFGAATLAERPVQPVALRYPHVERIHPTAPFVGDTHLMRHVWDMLGEREIEAELDFLPPIPATGMERKALAEQAREAVKTVVEGQRGGVRREVSGVRR